MKDIIQMLEEPETALAVVGATDDPTKYGFVIYRDLKRKGFKVYAVNRKRQTVDGDRAYTSLAEIPQRPTLVNLVVPPREARQVLQQCLDLGLMNVWLQPGAESPENLAFLQDRGFNYLANACIMVQSRLRG